MTATAGDADDAARAGGGKTKSHRIKGFWPAGSLPPGEQASFRSRI